jgi:hypothetical protein
MAMKMAMESMKMAPGAITHTDRVPEQRHLSPKLGLRWRRHCGTFHGLRLLDLGFSCRRPFIGERAMSEGARGAHTMWWHGQRWARTTLWCGRLAALLCLPLGLRVRDSKIGTSGFV